MAVVNFVRGFREMMRLTTFRGPWAYRNMEEVEAREPESAYQLGELAAVILVRGDEDRRYRARSADCASNPTEAP